MAEQETREVNVTALPYAVQEGTIQVPMNIVGEEDVKQYILEHWDEVSLGEVDLDYKGADFDIYDELEEEKSLE